MLNLNIAFMSWGRYHYGVRVHFEDGSHQHYYRTKQARNAYWYLNKLAYKDCSIYGCGYLPSVGLDPQTDYAALNGRGWATNDYRRPVS